MSRRVALFILLPTIIYAQQLVDLSRQVFGNLPAGVGIPIGTSFPGTCTIGQLFFRTDAVAGSNFYGCTSTNTWSSLGGGAGQAVNSQNGTSYTYLDTDLGKLVVRSNASPSSDTLPVATSMFATWTSDVFNIGAGKVTITPTTSTINGSTAILLDVGQYVHLVRNGSNYSATGTFVLDISKAGAVVFTQGSPPGITASAATLYAPSSITGYNLQMLAAACSGVLTLTNTANDVAPTCVPNPDVTSPANFSIKDDFPNIRTGASGTLGELGWGYSCTVGQLSSVASHFGIVNIYDAAGAGTACIFRTTADGTFNNATGLNAGVWALKFVFQITSGSLGSQTIKLGYGSADGDTANACAGDCILLQHDTAISTSIGLLTCSGGTCSTSTPTSGTLVTALNTWYEATISGASGTITLTIKQGANTQTTVKTTNIPSGNMTPFVYLRNVTTQPAIQLDFFSFSQTSLTRY